MGNHSPLRYLKVAARRALNLLSRFFSFLSLGKKSPPVPAEKYQKALAHEREFWKAIVRQEDFSRMQENWRKTAGHFSGLAEKYMKLTDRTSTLQIGPALQDAIDFWPVGNRFALDPLAVFYKQEFGLRGARVHSIAAVGERLPLRKSSLDIIICLNVLDHVSNPGKVLSESQRVLRPKGLLFLGVNVYPPSLVSKAGDDAIHFWRFSAPDVKKFLDRHRFALKEEHLCQGSASEGADWYWLIAENKKKSHRKLF